MDEGREGLMGRRMAQKQRDASYLAQYSARQVPSNAAQPKDEHERRGPLHAHVPLLVEEVGEEGADHAVLWDWGIGRKAWK